MSLLGLDAGTTGCKVAAYSAGGLCLTSAYREYPTLHPQEGWEELDVRLVLQRCGIASPGSPRKRQAIPSRRYIQR